MQLLVSWKWVLFIQKTWILRPKVELLYHRRGCSHSVWVQNIFLNPHTVWCGNQQSIQQVSIQPQEEKASNELEKNDWHQSKGFCQWCMGANEKADTCTILCALPCQGDTMVFKMLKQLDDGCWAVHNKGLSEMSLSAQSLKARLRLCLHSEAVKTNQH